VPERGMVTAKKDDPEDSMDCIVDNPVVGRRVLNHVIPSVLNLIKEEESVVDPPTTNKPLLNTIVLAENLSIFSGETAYQETRSVEYIRAELNGGVLEFCAMIYFPAPAAISFIPNIPGDSIDVHV
jgi:hypothetical protein